MGRRGRVPRRRVLTLAAVAATATGLALTGWATGVLDGLEETTVDTRFEVRGERDPSAEVVVVGVDDETLERENLRWPFPRAKQARFVDALHKYRPRLIVYDIQLTEASARPAGDLALYKAVSRARPVLLATTETDAQGRTDVFGGDEIVRKAGGAVGSGLFEVDSGDRVRRLHYEVDRLETLAVRAAQLVGRPVRRQQLPVWIDWAGPRKTIPTYSWSSVARRETRQADLEGKIVVVGVTAPREGDTVVTAAPGNGLLPGAEVHANAIATLVEGRPLRSSSGLLDALLIVLLACAVPLLAIRFSLRALIAAPVLLAGFLAAGQLAFEEGMILVIASPLLGLVLAGAGTGATLLFTEVLERRRLRAMFNRFVPEQVADQLIARGDDEPRLAGVELDATVLFCDLRGFSGFAEQQAASVVIALLNRYLEEMADAVLAHGGTVVAYMGDGMMAVFGAPVEQPEHARRALAAAQEMIGVRLERVNAWLAERGLETRFELGVGLNSGPVMSGTVGSERRLEYTAVGDTTNVASRLQALTAELGTPLLMANSTRERLGDMPGLVDVGEAEVRGREAPERLWTIRETGRVPEQMLA
jgi:adenylate cyclase